jgi:hypothetical protein
MVITTESEENHDSGVGYSTTAFTNGFLKLVEAGQKERDMRNECFPSKIRYISQEPLLMTFHFPHNDIPYSTFKTGDFLLIVGVCITMTCDNDLLLIDLHKWCALL